METEGRGMWVRKGMGRNNPRNGVSKVLSLAGGGDSIVTQSR